jgi:8-amino-7-oxononanoate synthase
VLDLSSSLYLGLRHAHAELDGWEALTTGVPAALAEPAGAQAVGDRLAKLVGVERGLVARSTLHAFLDLFAACREAVFHVDAGSYPIAGWPLAGLRCQGAARTFPHRDVAGLRERLAGAGAGRRPVVVADGFCPGCGKVAPIRGYLAALRPYEGLLVLDDTQALGVLGRDPGVRDPYGAGGGGSLQWSGARGSVVVVSSLAKAFGAPLTVLAGPAAVLDEVASRGPTRVHSSAPSAADLRAAQRALVLNARVGDELRSRLLWLVSRFRQRLSRRGCRLADGEFPVQRLPPTSRRGALMTHAWLERAGVRSLVTRPACRAGAAVTVVITAALSPADVDRAADLLAAAVRATAPMPEGVGP